MINSYNRTLTAYVFKIIVLLLFVNAPALAQTNNQYVDIAKRHMDAGRYGEAISALNQYVSNNPKDPAGYYLRGLSYEKRTQYENATLDLERAIKLAPDKQEYRADLARVTAKWHELLYKKIEGHKREIAISPENPANYVAIAESYAFLEKWPLSEEWYDKYLALNPNASPDEIIRYTNVLTETKALSKAEKKLEEYITKYPSDWRLLSRLGWINIWLGENRDAAKAFKQSLAIKPYFKEAEEGLDLAEKRGQVTQYYGEVPKKQAAPQEYPIDRYYRILKTDAENDEIRFKLIDELVKAERMEEAYQQLLKLKSEYEDTDRYAEKWEIVTNWRQETYNKRIEEALAKLELDPLDKESVYIVAKNYEYLDDYESALEILDQYFYDVPNETDPELNYLYARMLAWFKNFDEATAIMDKLVEQSPDNLDYLFFRAQLGIWMNQNLELAEEYMEKVYAERPDRVDVLLMMSQLEMAKGNFQEARSYLVQARKLDPLNEDILNQESNLELRRLRAEEEKNFLILEQGRKLVQQGKPEEALEYYEKFLEVAGPNRDVYKEYGDIQFRAKNFDEALAVYDSLLSDGFDAGAALQRGQVYFQYDQPEKAIPDLRRAVESEPENFYYRLYLGDAYTKAKMYKQAENQYDSLRTFFNPDSSQQAMLDVRRGWVPVTGLSGVLETFPSSIRFGPSAAFYNDDLGFLYMTAGGMLDIGVFRYLTVGVSFYRSWLKSDNDSRGFTTFKGNIFVHPYPGMTLGFGAGPVNGQYGDPQSETSAFFRLEDTEGDDYNLELNYMKSDAGLMLYSPKLLYSRNEASLYRVNGKYKHRTGLIFSGYYQYITAEHIAGDTVDASLGANKGNAIQFRLGKEIIDDLTVGYEYYYSNFRYDTWYYYSPIDFASHSAWGDFVLEETKDVVVTLGGRLGYVPESDYVLRGAYAKAKWTVFSRLLLQGRLGYESSSRDDSSYNSGSGELTISWMIL